MFGMEHEPRIRGKASIYPPMQCLSSVNGVMNVAHTKKFFVFVNNVGENEPACNDVGIVRDELNRHVPASLFGGLDKKCCDTCAADVERCNECKMSKKKATCLIWKSKMSYPRLSWTNILT